MKEIYGDAWELFDTNEYFGLFITTNGDVKANGEADMGKGIALECLKRYPEAALYLGERLIARRNIPTIIEMTPYGLIYSFPVKNHWFEKADIELIKESCRFWMVMTPVDDLTDPNDLFTPKFLLPRPGCGAGAGGLKWEDVKKVIEPLLDDRFYIVHFKEETI